MPFSLVEEYPQSPTKLEVSSLLRAGLGTEFHFVKIKKAGACHLAKPPMLSAVLIFLLSFFFLSALFLFGNIQKPLDVIFRSLIGFHQLLGISIISKQLFLSGKKLAIFHIQVFHELLGVPASEGSTEIEVSKIHAFKNHPFKVIDDDKMHDLVESIMENGVLTPVIVREDPEGGYEMISGHRRLFAVRQIGFDTIPAIVRRADLQTCL